MAPDRRTRRPLLRPGRFEVGSVTASRPSACTGRTMVPPPHDAPRRSARSVEAHPAGNPLTCPLRRSRRNQKYTSALARLCLRVSRSRGNRFAYAHASCQADRTEARRFVEMPNLVGDREPATEYPRSHAWIQKYPMSEPCVWRPVCRAVRRPNCQPPFLQRVTSPRCVILAVLDET